MNYAGCLLKSLFKLKEEEPGELTKKLFKKKQRSFLNNLLKKMKSVGKSQALRAKKKYRLDFFSLTFFFFFLISLHN